MNDAELLEAAARYRKISGKEPSLAWYAERGDKNAATYINFIGFSVMLCMLGVVVVGIIAIIYSIAGG